MLLLLLLLLFSDLQNLLILICSCICPFIIFFECSILVVPRSRQGYPTPHSKSFVYSKTSPIVLLIENFSIVFSCYCWLLSSPMNPDWLSPSSIYFSIFATIYFHNATVMKPVKNQFLLTLTLKLKFQLRSSWLNIFHEPCPT